MVGFMQTCACCILRGVASAVLPMVSTFWRKTTLGSVSLAARRCIAYFDMPDLMLSFRRLLKRHRTEKLLHVARALKESKHAPDSPVEKLETN